MSGDLRTRMGEFDVSSYWNNTAFDDPQWWWVYVLDDFDSALPSCQPIYVGMAKDLRRRLKEHSRYWTDPCARAWAFAMTSESYARQFEATLISLLEPTGNTTRPRLSWIEREHFDSLAGGWCRTVVPCGGCACLVRLTESGPVPVTEPDDECAEHNGPARRRIAEKVIGGLLALVRYQPPTSITLPSLQNLFLPNHPLTGTSLDFVESKQ